MSFLAPLALGYSTDQVVNFLISSFPHIGKKIKQAKNMGHDIESILKSFNGMDKKKLKQLDEKARHSPEIGNNPLITAQRNTQESSGQRDLQKAGKVAANVGKTALGLYAGSKLIPAATQGINALSGAFKSSSPNVGPTPMANAPVQAPQISGGPNANPLSGPVQGNIVPSQQGLSPPAQTQLPTSLPPESSIGIIEKMNVGSQIQNLQSNGNTPEQIAAALEFSLKPGQKKWLDEQIKTGKAKPLQEMVADYMSQYGGQQGKIPAIAPPESVNTEIQKPPEPEKIEKGSYVATPEGKFGEIESMRGKEALIKDENGKLHKVSSEELEGSPLPEKDLADLHEELIGSIEKETGQQVSRNVNWAGYDPEENTLYYLPHLGSMYTYDDVTPEDATYLTSLLQKRKSTGENHIGAWQSGSESPIGAAMSVLIKRLQGERGGKGKEYSKKVGQVYSAYEPAARAAKKKKDEERKRRKLHERQ